jgi:hypothetical protein
MRNASWSRSVVCATSWVRVASICQPTNIVRSCGTASDLAGGGSVLRVRERRPRLVRHALPLGTSVTCQLRPGPRKSPARTRSLREQV